MLYDFNLTAKLTRMENLRKERPAYREILEFYGKFYQEKEKQYELVRPRFMRIDESVIQAKLTQGYPVLDKSEVHLDFEALERFFLNLLYLSTERSPENAAALTHYLKDKGGDLQNMIRLMWQGRLNIKSWDRQSMGDPSLLFFLLAECLKPVYEYAARTLHTASLDELWGQRYCPICGSPPSIAETSGDWEGRLLFCLFCGIGWFFSSIVCPFCADEGDHVIKYLHAEHEKHYGIAVCNHCERYLKVIDTQAMGHHVPLDIENIVTLHVDMLALRKGFQRGANFLLLI